MAAATYLTRVSGVWLAGRLTLSERTRAALDAAPPAVLAAVFAPMALATGWPEAIAAVLTGLAALRLPLLGLVAVGVVAAVLLRGVGVPTSPCG